MKKFLSEFKKFALKGNVMDMAIGVIIATAFSAIVTSLVNDLFMPILPLLTGGVNVSGQFAILGKVPEGVTVTSLDQAKELGIATLNYGNFIQAIINFVLIALCLFLVVKGLNKMIEARKEPEAPKEPPRLCPYCQQEVDKKATRCPHCTSELPPEPEKK